MTRKEEILNYIDSILDTYRSSVVINNPEPNLLEDIAIHISSKLDNIKVVVVTNGYKRSVLLQNNIRNSNHELYSSHGGYLGLKNGSSIYFAKDYTDMCSRISDVILYENADEIKELNAFLGTQNRSRLALNIFFTNNTSFKIDFPKQEVYCCPNCKHRFSKLKKVENDFSVKYFRDESSILWDNLTGTINLPHYDTEGKSFVSQSYCPIRNTITYKESHSDKDGTAKPSYIGPITDYNIASKIIKKETSDSNFKYIIAYRAEEIGLFVAIIKTTKDLYIDSCEPPEWYK